MVAHQLTIRSSVGRCAYTGQPAWQPLGLLLTLPLLLLLLLLLLLGYTFGTLLSSSASLFALENRQQLVSTVVPAAVQLHNGGFNPVSSQRIPL
jgi:hypothetical protein